jgi:hypothetical protein
MVTTQANDINDFHPPCHHPFYLAFPFLYELCAEEFLVLHKWLTHDRTHLKCNARKNVRHYQAPVDKNTCLDIHKREGFLIRLTKDQEQKA